MYCTQDALIVFFFDGIFVCKVQFNTDNQLLAIKIWQKLAQGDKALVLWRGETPIKIAASHISVGTKEEDNVIKPLLYCVKY